MKRGRFLVLEGAEGTGKSTHAARLVTDLRGKGQEVVHVREPGGTPVGEEIREVLLRGSDLDIPRETELLLILAARAALVRQVVEPALSGGTWVVADRFDLSTFAYQGYGRGIDPLLIAKLNGYATGGLRPDLYLVLDVEVEVGVARQSEQGKVKDRFESEGRDFRTRVREGYLELANSEAGATLIPADGDLEAVEARIRGVLERAFPETFAEPVV